MRETFKIILIDLLIFLPLFAQENQIHFDHISTEQGLSQTTVFSIAQDSSGFMWFATEDGLNRYDGYTFKVYRNYSKDSNSISEIGVRKLFVDRNGNLWIITLGGKLDRFDPVEETFLHYSFENNNSPSLKVTIISIAEDNHGIITAASSAGVLYKFRKTENKFIPYKFKAKKRIPKNLHLQCMHIDKSGIIWLGAWEGLFGIVPNFEEIKRLPINQNKKNFNGGNAVFSITEDKTGKLWVAFINGGVGVFDKLNNSFKVYRHKEYLINSISSDRVMSIYCDTHSNIWIGTLDKGIDLYKPDKKKFLHYKYASQINWSLGSGAIFSIFEDRGGCLWFGTSGSGVSKYDRKRQFFSQISYNENISGSISHNAVLAICEDNSGALWVGTDGGGLDMRPPGVKKFKHFFRNPGSISSNSVTSIYADRSNIIWVGTDPGINNSAGNVFKYIRRGNSFVHLSKIKIKLGGVTTILEDNKGDMWIGTAADGIKRYIKNSDRVIEYRYNKDSTGCISGNSVFAAFEDSRGSLWFGTVSKGVNRFNRKDGTFKTFINDPENSATVSSNTVWCFAEDSTGAVWMGTWGGGLNKYNPDKETFKSFTTKDGLPSNIIYGMISYNDYLWIGTSRGITRFNTKTYKVKNYDDSDGLHNPEFNLGAYCKGKDGILYFGGTNGITFFNPAKIETNNFAPSIILTDFKVFDKRIHLKKSINYIKEIILSYKQNFFSFEFAALDYTAPGKNKYAYILEGVDKDWIYSGNRRFASYTNISPGEYNFRVKGSNNDGVWSSREAVVSVIITPPVWQTWWFRILSLLLLAAILYALHKYRLNKLLEVERTRIRIARDLHDDVSATITGMVYFSDAIENEIGERKTPVLQKLLTLIHESAESMQESMSDIIWSINPENDKWEIILPKFRRFASDLCESKGINYDIKIPETMPVKPLDMEKRRNLWLIFKEMVTNAVKHSGCTELKISISIKDDKICLIVSDNGKGFDSKINAEGNGLKNIKSRSKNLLGQVYLTSQHTGTKWELEIPVKAKVKQYGY